MWSVNQGRGMRFQICWRKQPMLPSRRILVSSNRLKRHNKVLHCMHSCMHSYMYACMTFMCHNMDVHCIVFATDEWTQILSNITSVTHQRIRKPRERNLFFPQMFVKSNQSQVTGVLSGGYRVHWSVTIVTTVVQGLSLLGYLVTVL